MDISPAEVAARIWAEELTLDELEALVFGVSLNNDMRDQPWYNKVAALFEPGGLTMHKMTFEALQARYIRLAGQEIAACTPSKKEV